MKSREELEKIRALLLKYPPAVITPLFDYAKTHNQKGVEGYLNNGMDVDIKKYDGFTEIGLLHAAIGSRDLPLAELLIMRGADVNLTSKGGATPLMYAPTRIDEYRESSYDLIQLLMRHGADIDAKLHRGYTALHYAAESEDILAVKTLLEHGANCSIKNKWGRTAEDETNDPDIRELIRSKRLEQEAHKKEQQAAKLSGPK